VVSWQLSVGKDWAGDGWFRAAIHVWRVNEGIMMKPGQLEPNEFESAILKRLTHQEAWIGDSAQRLHVLSREFTGVGSFTRFHFIDSAVLDLDRQVCLDALIRMPGVADGMGAVLFCKGNQLDCLEVYINGDAHWDGIYEGFAIE
jgi:hypothetical protein